MESKKIQDRDHETWLEEHKGSSQKQYKRAWRYFKKFLGDKNEAWVLENKTAEDWASHLVEFHRFLKNQPVKRGTGKLSDNTCKQLTAMIQGYMVHIGLAFNLTRAQKDEITKVEKQVLKDYPINLKAKEKLLRVASPTEEYIVSAGISFGLRIGDFLNIKRGQLEPLLDREVPIQLAKIITKKKGEIAYPLIDKDAKEAIERLLELMDEKGRTSPEEPMLKLGKYGEREVNKAIQRLFKRAEIPLGEFRIRFHCLRKFLTDNLASVCSEDKWKWFVGKKTKGASPYVTEEGRKAYKQVMQFTCVNGMKARMTPQVEEMQKKIDSLEEMLKDYMEENKRLRELDHEMLMTYFKDIGYVPKVEVKKEWTKEPKEKPKEETEES